MASSFSQLTSNPPQTTVSLHHLSSQDRRITLARILVHFEDHKYQIRGIPCCRSCFQHVHGVTKFHVEAALELLHHGCKPDRRHHLDMADRAARHLGRPVVITYAMGRFMDSWLARHTMINARDGRRHLGFQPIGRWLYDDFVRESSVGGSYHQFLLVFDKKMASVSVPRGKLDLKACSRCFQLMARYRSAAQAGDGTRMERIRAEMELHQQYQYGERDHLHELRDASAAAPSELLFVVLDATYPVNMPSITQDSDFKRSTPKLALAPMALINHARRNKPGGGKEVFFYVAGNGKDGANENISYLHHHLLHLGDGERARKFVLQLDSGSGGKNKFMIAYLAYAVTVLRWFDEVNVFFLIAGHTGEDVDGMTAKFRLPLRKGTPCVSGADLASRWGRFFPNPDTQPQVSFFFDAKRCDGSLWSPMPNGQAVLSIMQDWKAFFVPHLNYLSGYTDKNATMTEASIHCWRINAAGLSVKRLAVLSGEHWSAPVEIFHSPPVGNPKPLHFGDPALVLAKPATESPLDVARGARAALCGAGMLQVQDELWWDWVVSELEKCELPLAPDDGAAAKRQKRKPKEIDVEDPPMLISRRPAAVAGGDPVVRASDIVDDDDNDGESPEYEVERITDKRLRDDQLEYYVWWAKPYSDHGWQPAENLVNCAEAIDAYERAVSGKLTSGNAHHAELQHELREQEHAAAVSNMVECEWCHQQCRGKRGLTTHQRSCKQKPD